MINDGVFSSKHTDWESPRPFVSLVEKKFNIKFDLDACALNSDVAKADKFFTPLDNALIQKWEGTVCMNPPYGRQLPSWMKYAYEQSLEDYCNEVCCLIPARPDTGWFHDYAIKGRIYLLRGKINFLKNGYDVGTPAFPSMIVRYNKLLQDKITPWDWKKEKLTCS